VRKLRKQKITLRFKRREHIKTRVRAVVTRSVVLALLAGFGMGIAAGPDSMLSRFVRLHTPQVEITLPQALTGLPIFTELPSHSFWLWLPGMEGWTQRRITKRYAAVHRVRFKKFWNANRVQVHVYPRVPLVMWNGKGFDREGRLFPTHPAAWKFLPQAQFQSHYARAELGRWLGRLANVFPLWSQVVSIRQDSSSALELTLKTGAIIIWGLPENEGFARKIQALQRVLDDMHTNFGGAARADLRFFDQGRIIVLPKSVKMGSGRQGEHV
jgi:hypothetical protein